MVRLSPGVGSPPLPATGLAIEPAAASAATAPLGRAAVGTARSAPPAPPTPIASRRRRHGPPVAEVLDVDREYRERATAGDLPRVAPRHFNPQGNAWLPVLHTHRGRHRYTALFSNSERAHHLGRTRDWVIVICASGADTRQYTVITAERGRLRGRRIIPGRERQCAAHYLRCRSMGAGASPGEPRGSVGCSDPRHELATKDAGP